MEVSLHAISAARLGLTMKVQSSLGESSNRKEGVDSLAGFWMRVSGSAKRP